MSTASSGPRTSSAPGLLTAAEFRRFDRAERFFWSVRCHLHLLAGRAEERLNFDYQPRIAEIMNYADRPGKSAVERFMQFYFLNAKTVGDLTGVFLAQLDEQLGKKGFRFALPTIRRRPKRLGGFVLDRGRISIPSDDFFRADPVRLIELFARRRARAAGDPPGRDARRDPRRGADRPRRPRRPARQRLVHGSADLHQPSRAGASLDERGRRVRPLRSRLRPRRRADAVRHVPSLYGRRAFDPRDRPARGDRARRAQGRPSALDRDHPEQIASRRVLYVAVLLHDIAKGRGGDHSVHRRRDRVEARPALRPRPGRDRDRFVAGALSSAAVVDGVQARPRRPQDDRGFRPPGAKPGAASAAADPDRGRHPRGRAGRVERMEADAAADLVRGRRGAASARPQAAWPDRAGAAAAEGACRRARLEGERGRARMRGACPTATGWPSRSPGRSPTPGRSPKPKRGSATPSRASSSRTIRKAARRASASSRQTAKACSTASARASPSAGANIIDARIHTTRDGMALDNLLVLDGRGQALCRPAAARPAGQGRSRPRLQRREPPPLPAAEPRAAASSAFEVAPSVAIAERASTRTTVVEVNARDRPALLAALAAAIHDCGHHIHSAHIATYGERAVDVFYLTRADGQEARARRHRALRAALLARRASRRSQSRLAKAPQPREAVRQAELSRARRARPARAAVAAAAAAEPAARPPAAAAAARRRDIGRRRRPVRSRACRAALRRTSAARRGTRRRAASRRGIEARLARRACVPACPGSAHRTRPAR